MPSYNFQARERLINLLKLELGKELGYDDLRSMFETIFNFELDRASVSEQEFKVFQSLFNKVVWYSPFSDERAAIPNYIGEAEMDTAVAEARRALGLLAEGT